ncbi:YqaJ viral recombinase family protein [Hydrogenophaga pseudoflava]|uniref:YqaJ viral recombinase family protein n=1 Tax=Hydrogenophaga pseudoflava TaxID=47421 RepID=UPI0027E538CE|nr:YqaJ viral recombinase family protein [Hydrogenophaga pseudoflava]MDQ7745412.1 YqaJ viral recombinase family protein [Hydrogenophaga pseudoflava]
MNMTFHDFAQGSPEWHQHRATHFNASDAPAMMGCSPYQTRTELLARMKTGISAEVDAATQRRFDDGHRFEALARPRAERIIGDDLYPVTGSRGELSASFDGLTLDGSTAFEHKSLNDDLRRAIPEGDLGIGDSEVGGALPLQYRVQMEQQMLVSGAARVLFMASKWDSDSVTLIEERHCWYESDAELRAKIVAGWEQFAKDLAEFKPFAAEAPKPTGKAPESLPALRIEVTGAVTASNLSEFKAQALAVFQGINRDLQTDDDFANAEATVKWAKGIEDRLSAAKESALAQTESIDTLFRTIDDISAEARRVRLDLDKLVKARKEAIKSEIVAGGVAALAKHIRELNAAMPKDFMPMVPADFGGAIKGLRTVDSIRNAVDTELARTKIAASEIANRIHANIGRLDAANAPMLFAYDMQALVLKQPDDLAAVIAQRLAAEQQRKEAERERILAEEKAREAREQANEAVRAAQSAAASAPAPEQAKTRLPVESAPVSAPAAAPISTDSGARLTLGQINDRLAPISITVGGLSTLGFEPVAVVKAARMYRECDFGAICRAISEHVLAAAEQIAEAA